MRGEVKLLSWQTTDAQLMSSRMTTNALGTLRLWTDTQCGHSPQEVFHGRFARALAVPRGSLRVSQHRRLRVPERVDGDGKGEG